MKRRMTREEYEALRIRCLERGVIMASGFDQKMIGVTDGIRIGMAEVLEELVDVEEPKTLRVPFGIDPHLARYLEELDARVRKLEGR